MPGDRVFVLGGFCGSTLTQQNFLFPKRVIWYNQQEIAIYAGDNLQLAADGHSPGPLAGNPCLPTGPVGLGVYQPLLAQLKQDGWEPSFIPYDWRLSVARSSADVAKAMNDIGTGAPFWMVCHSMGGLVAREVYQHLSTADGNPNWQRTVYLGTPHGGAYSAAMNLASYFPAGTFGRMLAITAGVALRRVLSPMSSPASVQDRFAQALASWPGLYDLLPNIGLTYGALDPKASLLWNKENYTRFNEHVSQANLNVATIDQADLENALKPPRPSEVCVVGYGQQTPTALADVKQLDNPKGYTTSNDGDGTVLEGRGTLPGARTLHIQGDHYDIVYGNAILSRITSLLRDGLTGPTDVPAPADSLKPPVFEVPTPPLATIEFPFIQKRGDP